MTSDYEATTAEVQRLRAKGPIDRNNRAAVSEVIRLKRLLDMHPDREATRDDRDWLARQAFGVGVVE